MTYAPSAVNRSSSPKWLAAPRSEPEIFLGDAEASGNAVPSSVAACTWKTPDRSSSDEYTTYGRETSGLISKRHFLFWPVQAGPTASQRATPTMPERRVPGALLITW